MADERYTWLQASPRGNGIGISLLSLEQTSKPAIEISNGPAVVAFNILPKLWPPSSFLKNGQGSAELDVDSPIDLNEDKPLWIDLQEVLASGQHTTAEETPYSIVFAVREGDFIKVPSSWKERLLGWRSVAEHDTISRAEGGIPEDADETTVENDKCDYAQHPFGLAKRAAPRRSEWISGDRCLVSSDPQNALCETAVREMWNLIEAHHNVEPDFSGSLADLGLLDLNLESLKHFFWRTFLNEAEQKISSFRYHFSDVTDEIMAVRGRMPVNELVHRQALRRIPVVCEFSDLRADSPIWVLVRGALRIVAAGSSESPDLQQTAMTLDTRLNQVPIKFQHELVKLCNVVRVGQRDNHLRRLVILAKFVVRQQFPAAFTSAQTMSDITTILFPTSTIWESLISEFIDESSESCFSTVEDDALSFEIFDSGHAKIPDLTISSSGSPNEKVALIDGKYKFAHDRITVKQLSMSDQYQMFAYAAISKLDTAVVNAYDRGPGGPLRAVAGHRINRAVVADLTGGIGGDDLRPNVAVFPLPFPRPGEVGIPMMINDKPVGTELLQWLKKAQERIRLVNELHREAQDEASPVGNRPR